MALRSARLFGSLARFLALGGMMTFTTVGVVACSAETDDAELEQQSEEVKKGDEWRILGASPNVETCLVREPDQVVKFSRCYGRTEEAWQIQTTAPRYRGVTHSEQVGYLWKVTARASNGTALRLELAAVEWVDGAAKLVFLRTVTALERAQAEGRKIFPVQGTGASSSGGNFTGLQVFAGEGKYYALSFQDAGADAPEGVQLAETRTRESDARLFLTEAAGNLTLQKTTNSTCSASQTCGTGTTCRWEGSNQCLDKCGIAAGPDLWACMDACNQPGSAMKVENGSYSFTYERVGFCGKPTTFEQLQTRCIDRQDANVIFCSGSQLFAAGYDCAGNHDELFRCDAAETCRAFVEKRPGETIEQTKARLCVPHANLVLDIGREACLAHPTHCLEEHDGLSLCWKDGSTATTGKYCNAGTWGAQPPVDF